MNPYSQEFRSNRNYFEPSRELEPRYSGSLSEMGQYYPKPLNDRRPYYPEPLNERGPPYYPESYNERGPPNLMGPSYSVPFSGFNSSLSRYSEGNRPRPMQPNFAVDDAYSIVPSVVGRHFPVHNDHEHFSGHNEGDFYQAPNMQPLMRKRPVHLRLKRGRAMKPAPAPAPIAKPNNVKTSPGNVMKRLGSVKREIDDGPIKNDSNVKKQKLSQASCEAEAKEVNSIEENDVKSIKAEEEAEASKVSDVQIKEVKGVEEEHDKEVTKVQNKEEAKVQVKEVTKVQVKEIAKVLPKEVKLTKKGNVQMTKLTDAEAPAALYCHMCDQGSFPTIRSYHVHLEGIKHREISRAFHETNQSTLNSLRQKANLACLRHANPTMIGPTNKICDFCFVVVSEGFRTHNKLVEHMEIADFLRKKCCGRNYGTREQYEEHKLTLPHLMRVFREKELGSDETKQGVNSQSTTTHFQQIINKLKLKNGGEKYLSSFDGKTMLGINSLQSKEIAYCKSCQVDIPLDLQSLEDHLVLESHFDSLPKAVVKPVPPVPIIKNESKFSNNKILDVTAPKKESKLITKFMRERDDSDSEEDDEDSGNELLSYIMNTGDSDSDLEAEVAESTTNEVSPDADDAVTTNGLPPDQATE